jgi:hypothetical protein
MTDWSEANVRVLLQVFGASIGLFLLLFVALLLRVRLRFAGQRADAAKSTPDPPELVLIKLHTRVARLMATATIALQLPLLLAATNIPVSSTPLPYSLRLVRPIANMCALLLGFTTNTHAAFRVAFLLLLAQIVAVDTVAEVSFAMSIACLELQALQCGPGAVAALSLYTLHLLRLRELAMLLATPWLMLEVGFLAVTIGLRSPRYSGRQLSLSRPTFHLRAALAQHFPSALSERNRDASGRARRI